MVSSSSPGIYFASDVFTVVCMDGEQLEDGSLISSRLSFSGDGLGNCYHEVMVVTDAEEDASEIGLGEGPVSTGVTQFWTQGPPNPLHPWRRWRRS